MTRPKKETSEKRGPPAGQVKQLTSSEVDSLREEAKRDGAWAKLRLGHRERRSESAMSFAHGFPNDIVRMRNVLAPTGLRASEAEIVDAWTRYSGSVKADWMQLPDDDDQLLKRLLFELEARS